MRYPADAGRRARSRDAIDLVPMIGAMMRDLRRPAYDLCNPPCSHSAMSQCCAPECELVVPAHAPDPVAAAA